MSHNNLIFSQLLVQPNQLFKQLVVSKDSLLLIKKARDQVSRIIQGIDDRLLVITGPCSIHNIEEALEYAYKLKKHEEFFNDELLIIMRVYLEKPRTTIGWKGIIYDPYLDGVGNINDGLHIARKLLLDIVQMGLLIGTEFLNVLLAPFIEELITWGAIGARTCENQIHREFVSGLLMPVGFKNSPSGDINAAINSAVSSKYSHQFLGIDNGGNPAIFNTLGNRNCHIVLRGSKFGTNYEKKILNETSKLLEEASITPYILVDCSHGNSEKKYLNQINVAKNLCQQISAKESLICGVMLESYLLAGNQQYTPGKKLNYGQSITDACISWKDTVDLLSDFAIAVKNRRKLNKKNTLHPKFSSQYSSI